MYYRFYSFEKVMYSFHMYQFELAKFVEFNLKISLGRHIYIC
jgi:hypothetical protein